MIYAIYAALAALAFLLMLNGFLRGAKKSQIDAVLSILLLGLIVASFFVAGWKLGLLAIGVAFVSGLVSRPLAARTAARLLSLSSSGRSGAYGGLPPKPLERISQELGRPMDPSKMIVEMLSGNHRRESAIEALLDYCEAQPAIQTILSDFHVSRDDLRELYSQLEAAGAGQWACGHFVAASAIAYPEALRYVLAQGDGAKLAQLPQYDVLLAVVYTLIMHFERGAPLEG
jgi:hypothetical protein